MTTSPFMSAARAALQWRLLLLWAACVLLPTLLVAFPVHGLLAGQLDHAVGAPALARALDLLALGDLAAVAERESGALGTAGLVAIVLMLALSPLLTGAIVTAARAPTLLAMRPLLAGALAEYPRMARMLCWAAVPLGLAALAGSHLLELAGTHAKTVVLYADARRWSVAAGLAAAVLVLLANLTLDAGRAALAI
ncbi:hypothetical protein, partial [Pseudoduganella buxea]|nr:hypothetical protein [Pseudoduganella buxea]